MMFKREKVPKNEKSPFFTKKRAENNVFRP